MFKLISKYYFIKAFLDFVTSAMIIGGILFFAWIATGCARNVDYVKQHAEQRLQELGYTNAVYEGYQWSPFCGGDVWYQVNRPNSKVLYSLSLCKWGDELHMYGPRVVSGQDNSQTVVFEE